MQPQHASLCQPRQVSDHLEPHTRRNLLRLPQTKLARPLTHRLRLRKSSIICQVNWTHLRLTKLNRLSLLMEHTPYPLPGTRPFVSGSSQLVPPPVVSSATPTMSSPFPSPPTTVKSSQARATELSSCGTLSVT